MEAKPAILADSDPFIKACKEGDLRELFLGLCEISLTFFNLVMFVVCVSLSSNCVDSHQLWLWNM